MTQAYRPTGHQWLQWSRRRTFSRTLRRRTAPSHRAALRDLALTGHGVTWLRPSCWKACELSCRPCHCLFGVVLLIIQLGYEQVYIAYEEMHDNFKYTLITTFWPPRSSGYASDSGKPGTAFVFRHQPRAREDAQCSCPPPPRDVDE